MELIKIYNHNIKSDFCKEIINYSAFIDCMIICCIFSEIGRIANIGLSDT